MKLDIGKVPNDILKSIILGKIRHVRDDILIRPGIGEDCSAVEYGDYACVLSTDPITGTENEIGRLAVHISCNDIASCGVEPVGLMVTILAPPGTHAGQLEHVMQQLSDTAASINVEILGGHTEITDAVNRFVIMSTAVGKACKDKLVTSSGACEGDYVILTKHAGLEGATILAFEKAEYLRKFISEAELEKAKSFMNDLSVVKEGVTAGRFGATSMHDVTEGGVLGAAWEIAEAAGKGIFISKESIPVDDVTAKICGVLEIDPLKLVSSGCMLITCADGEGLVKELASHSVNAAIIGRITSNGRKILAEGEREENIMQPGSDELYGALAKC